MTERTQYEPGTFCWTDLTTTDQDAAKAFYTGLFGWEIEDLPVGDGVVYSMARIDGKDVAAISPQPQMLRDAGAPPTWNSYASVESADATAERAQQLGGTVVTAPFDVMEAGRMTVLQDPHGAFFMAWQAGDHFGAQLVTERGALCWNELASPDIDASAAFYADLFGWTTQPFEGAFERYLVIKNCERSNGGIRSLSPPGVTPHWLVYFAIEDLEAGLARAQELGGTTQGGPIDLGIARIGIVTDPQGATFGLYDGMLQA